MIPKTIQFFVSTENKALIRSIMGRRSIHPVNLLILGKHGLGKSELARQIAVVHGLDYVPVPISTLQETGQLMGRYEFKDGETKFVPSEFARALRTPNTMIHLEELNRPESPKALGELFPLLDDSRAISHESLGTVEMANGVVVVATLNEGFEYSGIDPLDEALRDRFFVVQLGYLPVAVESSLVTLRTGLSGTVINDLLNLVNNLRSNDREPVHVSTRRVLMMAELIMEGLPFKFAAASCLGLDKDKMETVLMNLDFSGKLTAGTELGGQYELLSV